MDENENKPVITKEDLDAGKEKFAEEQKKPMGTMSIDAYEDGKLNVYGPISNVPMAMRMIGGALGVVAKYNEPGESEADSYKQITIKMHKNKVILHLPTDDPILFLRTMAKVLEMMADKFYTAGLKVDTPEEPEESRIIH